MSLKKSDVETLSDMDLAILTYAMERFADTVEEGSLKRTLIKRTYSIASLLDKEYEKRGLHFSSFYKRE